MNKKKEMLLQSLEKVKNKKQMVDFCKELYKSLSKLKGLRNDISDKLLFVEHVIHKLEGTEGKLFTIDEMIEGKMTIDETVTRIKKRNKQATKDELYEILVGR